MTLFSLNKNLKRKRVNTKSLPEAWTAPKEIAGQKTRSTMEDFRQNWRKKKYQELRKNLSLIHI
eukprot:5175182-Alexandrium_andersonii.AAC.1